MGRGTIEPRRLRKLLRQLCWLSRPNAGLSCFMAGSYQALDSGARWFTRSMARGLGTVLMFSAVAQSYPPDAHEGGMQQVPGKRDLLLFADAAPDGERFRVGLVGDKRLRRSIRCPAWVTSLQQNFSAYTMHVKSPSTAATGPWWSAQTATLAGSRWQDRGPLLALRPTREFSGACSGPGFGATSNSVCFGSILRRTEQTRSAARVPFPAGVCHWRPG